MSAASHALANTRSGSKVCGVPVKLIYSAVNALQGVKDDESIREMLTVVVRVRRRTRSHCAALTAAG